MINFNIDDDDYPPDLRSVATCKSCKHFKCDDDDDEFYSECEKYDCDVNENEICDTYEGVKE